MLRVTEAAGFASPQRITQVDTSTKVLAEFLSRVRGREAKQTVREKVSAGTCLLCDQPAAAGSRGHCDFCHGQYKYARALYARDVVVTREEQRRGVTRQMKIKEKKAEFDESYVRRGWILVSQQGKHGKPNPFRAA